jgi:adenylosuccinate lyase
MTNPLVPSLLLRPLVSSAALRAIVDDRARLQRMLDFEAALTRAEAAVGVIPASAVDPIAAACRAECYDIAALGEAAAAAGNLVGPLVSALTAEVAKTYAAAASRVHWGASGQDVSSVARTAMRHTLPMPFGLKVAGNAAALGRSRERLKRLRRDALVLQFGGAVGTLAALGDQGLDVTERLSALLDLPARRRPGTPIATGWRKSHWRLESWPAPAARSAATSRFSCKARSPRCSSPPLRLPAVRLPAKALPRCRPSSSPVPRPRWR